MREARSRRDTATFPDVPERDLLAKADQVRAVVGNRTVEDESSLKSLVGVMVAIASAFVGTLGQGEAAGILAVEERRPRKPRRVL